MCVRRGEVDVKRDDYVILDSDLGGDLALVIDVGSRMCQSIKGGKKIPTVLNLAT